MANLKVIFVAFPIEDEHQRDLLKGQSLNTKCPFEYVDLSVKERYESNWKERVRTRIRRSNGVIALISKNTLNSSGETWEINCAKEEGKPMIGLWIYKDDYTRPVEMNGYRIIPWTWQGIADFIDGL
ncbi:MAG TPA: TIR domain-containing protein [Blastocatellia bacterium]|nr:TIR domain-containing protein [Blastocatellia bacterium]